MIALLGKELYQLKAYLWLLLGITVLAFAEILFTERFDELRFDYWCDSLCQPGIPMVYGLSLMLISFVVAYALFPVEHDELTIDFLHALPVSRGKIFIAKFLAGFLIIVAASTIGSLISAVLLAANPQSIDGKLYSGFFVKSFIVEQIFVFTVLAHGILLSWFRALGLIFYFVYLILLITIDQRLGNVGVFSVFSILEREIIGQSMHLAWNNILVHLVVTLLVLWVAFKLWSRDHLVSDIQYPQKSRLWLKVGSLLVLFCLAVAVIVLQSRDISLARGNNQLATINTQHYRFVAPPDSRQSMDYIRQYADQDYRQLTDLLNTDERPTIQTDMTSQSRHALGIANWKRIYMNLSASQTDREYRRILSHETAHIFQSVLTEGSLSKHAGSAKFFTEGMAQYTSFEIIPNPELRESNWQLAAMAWERLNIEFADVVDFANFVQRFDENLVYSLGDVWAQALVDSCGEKILGDILRTVGEEGSALLLTGESFWRHVLAQNTCDLGDAVDRWIAILKSINQRVDKQLFPVFAEPRLTKDSLANRVHVKVAVSLLDNAVKPERFMLKVQSAAKFSGSSDPVFLGRISEKPQSNADDTIEVTFVVPESATENATLRFQLGYVPNSGERVYFSRWQQMQIAQ